ncbi:MAG: DsbA family protein [Rhodobacteraceae bacterium]|nr:DsbA family protein [Paracoccaceae bacterium]
MVRNALFAALVAVAAAGSTLSAGPALSQTSGAALSAPASDADREAFRAEVRAYLMEHPEVIFEAVAEYERRQQAAQADMDLALVQINADDIFHDDHSWVTGNPDGDVTLVEFMDYRCGYCRRAQPAVLDLVSGDGNIRLVIKEFPILGPQSEVMSRFALAVQQLGGDEPYARAHEALMSWEGDISADDLRGMASDLGLDGAAVLAAMNGDSVTAVLRANHELAQRLQISGTPTFVMGEGDGGELLRGYMPLEQMQQAVARLRS